jgi:hypothetical protein
VADRVIFDRIRCGDGSVKLKRVVIRNGKVVPEKKDPPPEIKPLRSHAPTGSKATSQATRTKR